MKNIKRRLVVLLGVIMILLVVCVSASAVETDTTTSASVISAFHSAFQDIASNALIMIAGMVPIALSIAGVTFLIRKAMGWFKTMVK